ncbi:magnesium and cobalt transport protein CorA [Actinotalea ferrariae]|uniref:magnesium and cobalt transport protein CorA n=1 Tax=Actinotalea ferrariae TaxID=1386098 RepID=UPI001C8CBF35|nr:magnesium and cobalt transport protein CorA [Actinotalea ferrariae]MBX9246903.1 magnesium and cobalt transport protein CorA [Actinotalea ferrariae]
MSLVDNAVYVGGRRHSEPAGLEQTYAALRQSGGMAWIGLYRPDHAEIASVAREFDIHALAVEDTVKAHQRPKLERYGDVLFTVLRPARYLDDEERVEFGELHVFLGPSVVVTVRHAESPDLARVRQRMEAAPDLLRLGPEAVLYAILDEVVDEYGPVVAGLENDIDEIEDQLFAGDPAVSRRIYELLREVMAFQRATHPLLGMLAGLEAGADTYGVDDELRRHLRDVQDHVVRVVERADGFRGLLQNALTVNATIVAERQNEEVRAMTAASLVQNEEVKKISAWAAILFAPTLVGTVYGMNFDHMPELAWRWGYPAAVGLMVLGSVVLFAFFRSRKWL